MELTRPGALAALSGAGIPGGDAATALARDEFVEGSTGDAGGAGGSLSRGVDQVVEALENLDPGDAGAVLRRVGAATAEPDPDGTAAKRVRYHSVNEVLYALYAFPTGDRLVGVESSRDRPGGTDSYQRGPPG